MREYWNFNGFYNNLHRFSCKNLNALCVPFSVLDNEIKGFVITCRHLELKTMNRLSFYWNCRIREKQTNKRRKRADKHLTLRDDDPVGIILHTPLYTFRVNLAYLLFSQFKARKRKSTLSTLQRWKVSMIFHSACVCKANISAEMSSRRCNTSQ